MSSRASQWPCPQPPTTASTRWRLVKSTTANGHRGRTGPGRLRTETAIQSSQGCGFFELFDEDTAGVRPGFFAEPRPQEKVQRQTVEHVVDFVRFAPMVQIIDTPDPEQFIEMPKILLDDAPVRTAVRDTQLAEQLVEVPTIVPCSSLQRTVEHHVDIPVPGGGGRLAGLQGFLPGQSATAPTVEQNFDIPAPVEVFKIYGQVGVRVGSGSPAVLPADGSQVGHPIWRRPWLMGSGPRLLGRWHGGKLLGFVLGSTVDTWSASASWCFLLDGFSIFTTCWSSRILKSMPHLRCFSCFLCRPHLEIGHYVHEPLEPGSSCSVSGCTLHGAMLFMLCVVYLTCENEGHKSLLLVSRVAEMLTTQELRERVGSHPPCRRQ